MPEVKKAIDPMEEVEKLVALVGVAGAAKYWYLTPDRRNHQQQQLVSYEIQ